MAEQENILTRLGKLFQNQIVVRKTDDGQVKVKDVEFSQTALTSNFIDRYNKIHSNRLIDELFVFIYKSGVSQSKAEAMQGYNDDLVMSYSIALGLEIRL